MIEKMLPYTKQLEQQRSVVQHKRKVWHNSTLDQKLYPKISDVIAIDSLKLIGFINV